MPDRLVKTRELLDAHDQGHLLGGWDHLDDAARGALLDQLQLLPWDTIDVVRESIVHKVAAMSPPAGLEPPGILEPDPGELAALVERGEACIAEGQVAAFTVAGGQGTRLGWKGPKGTYPATPVSGKPLFAIFAEQILAAQRRYKVIIPWYIMTSPENDASTRAFFLDNKCFGLLRSNIMMFPQGTMPSFDAATGRLLLSGPGTVAMSPDGHGGAIDALGRSGALADMDARGNSVISYFQVDNPLARVIDPVFLGLHASPDHSSGEATSKMVPKVDPAEAVGVFCRASGRTQVVEYSDFPEELVGTVDESGRLRFGAANIALHLFSLSFIGDLASGTIEPLPWHRARKKTPSWDAGTNQVVEPTEPNAVKLERFIFDVLPRADRSAILVTQRASEFAPIKNASGQDSPASSHQIQSDLYASWLEQRGLGIPRDASGRTEAAIEIGPLTAMAPGEIPEADLPPSIQRGDSILL